MKVEIEVLRAAVNKLLDHAREMQGESVEIDTDLYWWVQTAVLHDPTKTPEGHTLGSLADDWSETAAVAAGTKEPVGYGVVWASTVPRALGERTP